MLPFWRPPPSCHAHQADPFDRVLVAHALRDDLSVLTREHSFAAYGVRPAVDESLA
jgi:PIN domain nuclease of toxin-antitoxin system